MAIEQIRDFEKKFDDYREGFNKSLIKLSEISKFTLKHGDDLKGFDGSTSNVNNNYSDAIMSGHAKRNSIKYVTKRRLESALKRPKLERKQSGPFSSYLKEKFRKAITSIVRKIKLMKLTVDEVVFVLLIILLYYVQIYEQKIFATIPYEKPGSMEFFKHVKNGEYSQVKLLLHTNKYYVYDFDNVSQRLRALEFDMRFYCK
jgi:hypothetical protein